MLGRDPTITEAVIWGIQGSEHCSYKSSKRLLSQFPTTGKHIILGPVEDSGIVAITDEPKGKRWGFVITHESHNHPSQIVPYEGAATGVGGTVRDVVCMGARVIGCMDMLRLGDLKTDESKVIAKEVVRGIAGYGNPLGVPNLGGDTVFDSTYNSNCLVNAIALGIVREDEIIHSYVPDEAAKEGYDIILVGKPTDKSGFGGASFASASMEEDKKEKNSGAVQEPNPFLERHLLASCYSLFDWLAKEGKLNKVSCKDLGAGGVVCASVEQVSDKGFGADINLDNVHIALYNLKTEVIACAETQERLCFTCHPTLTKHIIKHFNEDWDLPSVAENARASVIGKVTDTGIYRVSHKEEIVCEASAKDLTCGLTVNRPMKPKEIKVSEPNITENSETDIEIDGSKFSITDLFKEMIASPNVASKEPIFKHYDKNVIGNTIIEAGEADACVIAPLQDLQSYVHEGEHPGWEISDEDAWRGVSVAADGNNRYGKISPYWQGVNATVEAMRNTAAVGAIPRALTDCLNYGNPERAEQLWELAEGTRGIAETASEIKFNGEIAAIISGNVSLYNGKPDGSSIDPTAIVSCVGIITDARKAITMQLKEVDSYIYLVGERKDECGGSCLYNILEKLCGVKSDKYIGKNIPQPNFKEVGQEIEFVTKAIDNNLVLSSHDISNGGLMLALFETMLSQRKQNNNIGVEIDISKLQNSLPAWKNLFSETGGFILEVSKNNQQLVEDLANKLNLRITCIGKTTENPILSINNGSIKLFNEGFSTLEEIWKTGVINAWK